MFSMTKSKPHSVRKRIVANLYSKSHLQSSPDLHTISQAILFDHLLPLLDTAATTKQPLEVLELNFSATMDFIISFIFGLQNNSNFLQDIEYRKHWLRVYRSRRPYRFWNGEAPEFVAFFRRFGINISPKWVSEASEEIETWTMEKCKDAQNFLTTPTLDAPAEKAKSTTPATDPIVYAQLSNSLLPSASNSPKPSLTSMQTVATELLDHLAAGHETSGITLTYLMHELSLHPSLQARLRTELLSLSPPLLYPQNLTDRTPPSIPSAREIDNLPLLHALLMETLRIHAAIPGPQPRITPSNPTSLAGSLPLPGGVRVSAQAYSLHRNPVRAFQSHCHPILSML